MARGMRSAHLATELAVARAAMTWLSARLICLFKGHDYLRFCDAHRHVFGYECSVCGREMTWMCDRPEPRVTAPKTRARLYWLRGVHEGQGEARSVVARSGQAG